MLSFYWHGKVHVGGDTLGSDPQRLKARVSGVG